jgi:hypothetical protein
MLGFPKGLDRGEENVRFRSLLDPGVEAEGGLGANGAESRECLSQDFVTMGDEENAIGLELHGVEGGKPRFSKTGREDHEYRSNLRC